MAVNLQEIRRDLMRMEPVWNTCRRLMLGAFFGAICGVMTVIGVLMFGEVEEDLARKILEGGIVLGVVVALISSRFRRS